MPKVIHFTTEKRSFCIAKIPRDLKEGVYASINKDGEVRPYTLEDLKEDFAIVIKDE